MIKPDTNNTYKVDRLLEIFTKARDSKQAKVDALNIGKAGGMGAWAAGWPDGNTKTEQACVDALQAWKDAGVKYVKAENILSDNPQNPSQMGDVHSSFFMQLKNNKIRPVY